MRLVDPNLVQELFNQQQITLNEESAKESSAASTPTQTSAPPPPPNPQLPVSDAQQRAMIAQIMSLTDEQIGALPEDQRRQVLMVREQLARSK